jgi:hypothetical protein
MYVHTFFVKYNENDHDKEDKMVRACRKHGDEKECIYDFGW